MTSRMQIQEWFEDGCAGDSTHMIVICDTFDYEDFPKYVKGTADEVREIVRREDGANMQKVMEVYNLDQPMAEQLSRFRCWEY